MATTEASTGSGVLALVLILLGVAIPIIIFWALVIWCSHRKRKRIAAFNKTPDLPTPVGEDVEAGEPKKEEPEAKEAEPETKDGKSSPSDAKSAASGKSSASSVKSASSGSTAKNEGTATDPGKTGDGKTGDGKTGDGKTGDGKTGG